MYYKHKEWLEEGSKDSKCFKLLNLRKDLKISLHCLLWQRSKMIRSLASLDAQINKLKVEYCEIDLELSLIDGRYSIILEPPRKKKPSVPKNLVENLSKEDKLRLIAELQKIKG